MAFSTFQRFPLERSLKMYFNITRNMMQFEKRSYSICCSRHHLSNNINLFSNTIGSTSPRLNNKQIPKETILNSINFQVISTSVKKFTEHNCPCDDAVYTSSNACATDCVEENEKKPGDGALFIVPFSTKSDPVNFRLKPSVCGLCRPYSALSIAETNEYKNRPISPHLTIYHFELPALMSGSHRTTGMLLSTYALVLAAGALFLPHNLNYYMHWVEAYHLNWYFLATAKALVAFPFVYHFINGIRHLIWDIGKFLDMKGVYATGYTVIALVSVATIALGFFL